MNKNRYKDLLWNFNYQASATKRGPTLRLGVFSSEQELFQAQKAFELTLSTDLLFEQSYQKDEPKKPTQNDGLLLWEMLPPDITASLQHATLDQPLRLKISSNSPAVDDLPWEWLNDGGQPFALRPEIRLSRSVPIPVSTPLISVQLPLRVLLVLTNPKDERLLNAQAEIHAIASSLTGPSYELQILSEPNVEALKKALEQEPHIFHYVGHAGISRGNGHIILNDSNRISHWVSGQELASMLPLSVRLLCLSTCFSAPNYQIAGLARLAHTSAQFHLPTCIANRYPVTEIGVNQFWGKFYASLIAHRGNVNEAFHDAQQAITDEAQGDKGSFSLIIRDSSGHPMRLTSETPQSKEQYEIEIRAQFASRLANDLAQNLAKFGNEPTESLETLYKEEASKAVDLSEDMMEWDES